MMKWIVTGGAGFIGCNAVKRLLDLGYEVVVIDNLSRQGSKDNLNWLRNQGDFEFIQVDIRDFSSLQKVMGDHIDADVVLHLAAQVAVTTSVSNPREDFEINAMGTFNLLEAVRQSQCRPVILYASTNKVYGNMEHIGTRLVSNRYQYVNLAQGVDETALLDFHSPYGCSKGAADQYVRDYARIFNLKTVVFRQSCIYGCRQFGVEEQGWVAWFTIASVLKRPITIYGDGKQVRDVLFVDDLITCYLDAIKHIDQTDGQVYNIGGGLDNQLSLLELISVLAIKTGQAIPYKFANWRSGDQRVFVADIAKSQQDFGWQPKITVTEGLNRLYRWVYENQGSLKATLDNKIM